ncbi:Fpg/Nei family DNA glycosylase [Paenibacillus tarimensis]
MPEWPEMERYRTLLTERIVGETVLGTEITRDKSINVPADVFEDELKGRTIWFVERRGKHILFHLDNGKRLLLHLMLGGLMTFGTDEEKPSRTVQVTIKFSKGNLYFIGLRLGYLHLLTVKEVDAKLSGLGPDPLDKRLNYERFRSRFRGKRGALKSALVDQSVIAGIGNCYADEIAFTAGIRPQTKIPELPEHAWERLYAATVQVLSDALAIGGYMEIPFTPVDDLTGGYNERCLVYDRRGEPCRTCGNPIEQIEIASRKAFYCPHCQKERE